MPHGHHTATTYFNFSRSDDSLLPPCCLLKSVPVHIVVSPSFKPAEAALISEELIHLAAHAHQIAVLSSPKPLGWFDSTRFLPSRVPLLHLLNPWAQPYLCCPFNFNPSIFISLAFSTYPSKIWRLFVPWRKSVRMIIANTARSIHVVRRSY